MTDQAEIRFDDGAAYEKWMGEWSRRVGTVFLDWVQPDPSLRWIDVGCGNGAFSDLLFEQAAPAHVSGIDPSEAQLVYARQRLVGRPAEFCLGDAMELPFTDGCFDCAVMALVIFFVPDPAKGVSEMARVVRPGGLVSAYAWDIMGGGLPQETVRQELSRIGVALPLPRSAEAANLDQLERLWGGAGLTDVVTRQITVQRHFASFDEFYAITSLSPTARVLSTLTPEQTEALKAGLRHQLTYDASGQIVCEGRANAVKGRVRA